MPRVRRQYWLYPDLDSPQARRANRNMGRLRSSRGYGPSAGHAQMERSFRVKNLDQANLVSSMVVDKPGVHAPVIDIDGINVRAVPSSTEGNFHLYIDKEIPQDKYWALLDCLVDCGIVESGYVTASKAKGATFVRPPGVRKPKAWKDDWEKQKAVVQEAAQVREPEPAATWDHTINWTALAVEEVLTTA